MLNHPKTARGFTLVELLVTIALIGVVLGLAVPAFAQLSANYRVRAAGESLITALNLARAEAVRRNASVSFALVGSRAGWTVNDSANAVIQSRADSDTATLSVTSGNAATSVSFLPIGVVNTAGTRLTQVTLASSSSGTETRRIDIMGGGLIRLCNPAVTTANDPRRC